MTPEERRICNRKWQKKWRDNNKEKISIRSKKYYQENKEEISVRVKKYREDHRVKAIMYSKKYQQKNKEKISVKNKKYYQENKERHIIIMKTYYQENKEKFQNISKKYYQKNKEKIIIYSKKYRKQYPEVGLKGNIRYMKKLGAVFNLSGMEYGYALMNWKNVVRKLYGNYCAICGSTDRINSHHLIHKKHNPECSLIPSNGIPLCHEHHQEVHHPKKFKSKRLITDHMERY